MESKNNNLKDLIVSGSYIALLKAMTGDAVSIKYC